MIRTNKQKKEIEKKELWHYLRQCSYCGFVWEGVHCIHDGVQTPCQKCGKRPETVKGECGCLFDA